VEDETDIDDQDLATCDFKQERSDLLFEVSVIFWDEFVCIMFELSKSKNTYSASVRDFWFAMLCPCRRVRTVPKHDKLDFIR
jgi:hypothetical protein